MQVVMFYGNKIDLVFSLSKHKCYYITDYTLLNTRKRDNKEQLTTE